MKSIIIFYMLLFYILCNKNKDKIQKTYINEINTKKLTDRLIKKKNLVIGAIEKFPLYKILPFFKSFIHTNLKNCDIVMFVRRIEQSTINYLKNIGVEVHRIPHKYKNISIINIRWKMYIDFLKENKNKYKLIFSADIRDTIFQKDIFKYYEKHKPFLGVALEDGTLNSQINKNWIIKYVGKEKHNKIKNERIKKIIVKSFIITNISINIEKFGDFKTIEIIICIKG